MGRLLQRNHLVWLGPLLTFVAAVSYFTLVARFAPLRDVPWLNLPLAAAGVLLSVAGVVRARSGPPGAWRRVLAGAGLTVSLVLAGLFSYYVFALSYQLPAPAAATLALDDAPDFALEDHRGATVRLGELRGLRVVLVFYRGYW